MAKDIHSIFISAQRPGRGTLPLPCRHEVSPHQRRTEKCHLQEFLIMTRTSATLNPDPHTDSKEFEQLGWNEPGVVRVLIN
jgi:hypothetical protein